MDVTGIGGEPFRPLPAYAGVNFPAYKTVLDVRIGTAVKAFERNAGGGAAAQVGCRIVASGEVTHGFKPVNPNGV